jgi:cell division protein FtsL
VLNCAWDWDVKTRILEGSVGIVISRHEKKDLINSLDTVQQERTVREKGPEREKVF